MENTELIVNNNPKSSFSESIKTIRTNLQFSLVNSRTKTILLTSPEPGDGKSFISANLAVAFAQENKRVLLIDSDLRKGRQYKVFKVKNDRSKGYSNLILSDKSDVTINSFIIETDIKNLYLLPNGVTPPNPSELLSSTNNRELLDKLKAMFDIIILDCAPVLGLNDTLVMTKYSDVNAVVVTNKKTKVELLDQVKKNFERANAKIDGVILNRLKQKETSYYGYYGESE
ncbi:MAG: CpsD/CapB family tyrosine-protein kinase [Bacilli bacterium]|nr:CpsD/CapB family tyrosine-protein kinase [Bacilli bacterium]